MLGAQRSLQRAGQLQRVLCTWRGGHEVAHGGRPPVCSFGLTEQPPERACRSGIRLPHLQHFPRPRLAQEHKLFRAPAEGCGAAASFTCQQIGRGFDVSSPAPPPPLLAWLRRLLQQIVVPGAARGPSVLLGVLLYNSHFGGYSVQISKSVQNGLILPVHLSLNSPEA